MKYYGLVLAIVLFLPFSTASAQEVEFDVSVDVQQLPAANKEYVANFVANIKKYLSEYRWTTEDYLGEKIRCTIMIYFLSGSPDNRYNARVFIGCQRPVYRSNKGSLTLRIMDDKWEFPYVPGQAFYHNESQFDPLLSFLDFYALLVIGYDADTFSELGGTQYFQRASEIATRGVSAGSKGWQKGGTGYTRQQVVDDLLNSKYAPIRKAYYIYHFHGLDMLESNQNRALENMLYAIDLIGQAQKSENTALPLARIFFGAKYQEIADRFAQYPDRSVIGKFSDYDPAHQRDYEQGVKR
jgi:hypothetical protein